ncbi:unnamed protein product [Ceratitis capitata]|uniref:(Mediterranean fruit fly) hypothetical protein n=1 Tax=Ceratitis capitata TaxID=7213 RepID=A0A811U4Y8_CERCA|nr:unnamed protein product [Ceratitis capitata]
MILKLFTYYIILLTFLRSLASAQNINSDLTKLDKDLDKLLKDNADITNPSTPDEKEYKEERDKVQKAKDLAADSGDTEKMKTYERKLSAKLAFEIYIDRRENLKMRINQVMEVSEKSNKTQIADYLKTALDQINDIKESEIKRALDDLAETTTTTGPITTQTPESLISL